jgi:hypothetical protein
MKDALLTLVRVVTRAEGLYLRPHGYRAQDLSD